MREHYRPLIARLNGDDIEKEFKYYLSLVRKGIGGFIIFGGELETVRRCVARLNEEAHNPLIIASDLERGLGQQLRGGTPFPPAMALASAVRNSSASDMSLLRRGFDAVAWEASYAGINTIFAPVLDINTNPANPIIATRSFGEDAATVSRLGCEMIRRLQDSGIVACGKHFPGHGNTEVDSHIKLPTINRGLSALRKNELRPFGAAIRAGVKMIMLGHLCVPAIDPSGLPASVSRRTVDFLRRDMGYKGVIITDAMNMGGLGEYTEEEASLMALKAGVDIILHPSNPERVAAYLGEMGYKAKVRRLDRLGRELLAARGGTLPRFAEHRSVSDRLTKKAIKKVGRACPKGRPFLIVLNDEEEDKGNVFVRLLRKGIPDLRVRVVKKGTTVEGFRVPEDSSVLAAVFSDTKAWKGGASGWLRESLCYLEGKAELFISFGSPYLLDTVRAGAKMFVYWDSEPAQRAAARMLVSQLG